MDVQLDLSKDSRTPEQNAILEETKQAVRFLVLNGYKAKIRLNYVTNALDVPAFIEIE